MCFDFRLCDPAGIRTQDPYIKSVMLYRLSYGIILIFRWLAFLGRTILNRGANIHVFILFHKIFSRVLVKN